MSDYLTRDPETERVQLMERALAYALAAPFRELLKKVSDFEGRECGLCPMCRPHHMESIALYGEVERALAAPSRLPDIYRRRPRKDPKEVGLTGGIASGKSTVAKFLQEFGTKVIDADQVAREVVVPGTRGLSLIANRWPSVIGTDGRLDRKALGQIVFHNPEERLVLEGYLHPLIETQIMYRREHWAEQDVPYFVYESALIVESNLFPRMDALIVVSSSPEVQLRRTMERDSLTEEQARARLSAQMPLENKLEHASYVIDNTGDIDSLKAATRDVWEKLQKKYVRA